MLLYKNQLDYQNHADTQPYENQLDYHNGADDKQPVRLYQNQPDYHNDEDNRLSLDYKLWLPYLNPPLYLNPLDYHKYSLPNPNPVLSYKNQLDYHNHEDTPLNENQLNYHYSDDDKRLPCARRGTHHNGDTQGYLTRRHTARRKLSRHDQARCRYPNYPDDTHLLYLNQPDFYEASTYKPLQAYLNQNTLHYHTSGHLEARKKGHQPPKRNPKVNHNRVTKLWRTS